ncbi:hypothetical protein JAAARDRAFT_36563 [Jaapia argillacea MUCL 33604]|uniref:GIT Spa2 homology (SHD) domain-containing protein n=1 Tax=Jaapia argillacea MUCL 33604 TaxID=933084 RepID=A0A067PNM1_9AGAM|nr:hypothetical protein JAAARDRAFT_36563 [Jaapia argillacea MUCL 33604]
MKWSLASSSLGALFGVQEADSYRPLDHPMEKEVPDAQEHGLEPYRTAAMTHFMEFGQYLSDHIAPEAPGSRVTTREKLLKLTAPQFHELCEDVCDEVIRRKNDKTVKAVPFLLPRDDLHPKRNQARRKLSTVAATRFQSLVYQVQFELCRRYPQL